MKTYFNIGNTKYIIDVDKKYADILLYEYSEWFTEFIDSERNVQIQFERKNIDTMKLLNYYKLCNPEVIGENKKKNELIVSENNCIYMNTHLFQNEIVFISLNRSNSFINIAYFNDLTVNDLTALIKTAFILANNYLSKECLFLMHASAAEIKDNNSLIFMGNSGSGKTTVSMYCHENGYFILSDETILLWKQNDNYYVQGTPWHGSEKKIIGSSKISKLNSIYILNKYHKDFVKKTINKYENKCMLLNQWLNNAQFNKEKFSQGFEFITNLVNRIDIYKLFFTKSNHFIKVIKSMGVY